MIWTFALTPKARRHPGGGLCSFQPQPSDVTPDPDPRNYALRHFICQPPVGYILDANFAPGSPPLVVGVQKTVAGLPQDVCPAVLVCYASHDEQKVRKAV